MMIYVHDGVYVCLYVMFYPPSLERSVCLFVYHILSTRGLRCVLRSIYDRTCLTVSLSLFE